MSWGQGYRVRWPCEAPCSALSVMREGTVLGFGLDVFWSRAHLSPQVGPKWPMLANASDAVAGFCSASALRPPCSDRFASSLLFDGFTPTADHEQHGHR